MNPNDENYYNGAYNIHFQVWRPSPTVESDGCYSMVGENRFTSIMFDNVIEATPEPRNLISVRPGDVVGYFHTTNEGFSASGGIQLQNELKRETIWYHTNTDADPLMATGDETCPFPVGVQAGRILRSSTSRGPIISLDIGKLHPKASWCTGNSNHICREVVSN